MVLQHEVIETSVGVKGTDPLTQRLADIEASLNLVKADVTKTKSDIVKLNGGTPVV